MNSTAELWYVKLPDGDVHCVTVDQLDEAFQRGAIDRRTRVFAQDQRAWISLGEILGEDEMEAQSPVAAYGAPSSYAPRSQPPARYSYAAAMPSSVRPVSLDFEEDIDLSPYKSGSGKWVFAALLIVAGVGVAVGYFRPDLQVAAVAQVHARVPAIASTISRLQASLGKLTRGHEQAAAAPQTADVAPPPALPAATAAAAPAVQPAAAPAQPSATAATDGPPAVATATTSPAPKGATEPRKPSASPHPKAVGHAAGTGGSPRPKSSGTQPFTTGGNKFDPLNSSI
jgi:hypothetical protein